MNARLAFFPLKQARNNMLAPICHHLANVPCNKPQCHNHHLSTASAYEITT